MTRTIEVPVNAPTEDAAIAAIADFLPTTGRRLVSTGPVVEELPVRPFDRVALQVTKPSGDLRTFLVTTTYDRAER